MTVSSLIPVNNYTGNGSTCQFDFDFLIEDEKELVVTLINEKENLNEQLIFGVDYSINEIGNKNGSYIIFPLEESSAHSILSPDEVISLTLSLPIKQESEFENSATLKLDVLEWTLDYIIRILQILNRKIDRSIKIVEGELTKPEELVKNLFDAEYNSKNYSKAAYQNLEEIKEMNNKINSDMKKLDKELIDVLHKSSDEEITGVKNFTNEILYKGQNLLDVVSQDYEMAIKSKQDKLTAGDNITIKNNVISAEDGINNKISNCLLEVPQNIKLELTDGVLTLKAGSKVIVPNGVRVFDEVEITSDLGVSSGVGQKLLFYRIDTNSISSVDLVKGVSGETDSLDGVTYHAWYDTTNNLVKRFGDNASIYSQVSLPFALATFTDSTHCTIDQIFNGMGYIGSTIWIDKGVKGLIPNGRNEDGSLNNVEITTQNILTRTFSATYNAVLGLKSDYIGQLNIRDFSFDYKNNYCMNTNMSWNFAVVGSFTQTNGVISNFQPKLPFKAVDYNDNNLPQVDGQWVANNITLSTATAIGTYIIDLSEYLPSDNFDYEVFFSIEGETATNAQGTDTFNYVETVEGFRLGERKDVHYQTGIYLNGVLPIKKENRRVTFGIGGVAMQSNSLSAIGYRRLGTNQ